MSEGLLQAFISCVSESVDAPPAALAPARCAFVSPGVVALTEGVLGFKKGFLVRDPGGHAVKVAEF